MKRLLLVPPPKFPGKFCSGTKLSRREWLRSSFVAGATLLVGSRDFLASIASGGEIENPFQEGKMLGVLEFSDEARVPMDTPFGSELDERLYTDLSQLAPGDLLTPNAAFYIRTGVSKLLDSTPIASVKLGGLARKPSVMSVAEIERAAKDQGVRLMECAGNVRAVHFGLMSAAHWRGVAVADLIENLQPAAAASHVLISGFDQYESSSATSLPGASWIFLLDELKSAGAFLATEMNGEPLARDHGAPVRLVVPGWYGCACIKWVNEISLVGEDAATTSQMREYASRTMQNGVPQLVRDYRPAMIDAAAMPVRVEKWVDGGNITYRVVGIVWGGAAPAASLEIRFNPEEDYVPVEHPASADGNSWALWTHSWAPRQPGPYIIRLHMKDSRIPARRLDAGAYVRSVEITEV
jgi:DMSO/TMAO reductase YedYZ molybdopterin-dependent catalytic subunit